MEAFVGSLDETEVERNRNFLEFSVTVFILFPCDVGISDLLGDDRLPEGCVVEGEWSKGVGNAVLGMAGTDKDGLVEVATN